MKWRDKKSFRIFAATFVAIASCVSLVAPFAANVASAQSTDATSLTITPPFFTLNVSPGDAWASSIRVVNTNASNLPVVATVMGFAPSDEQGHGTFQKLSDVAGDPDALANWITVSPSSAIVPPDGAVDIPFSVVVPKGAAPGGHYAAVLIGTEPVGEAGTSSISSVGPHVGVSSFISALIFVTVSGDIKEAGNIEEFSTDKSWYQDPNVDFTIRFANTGNVHVRPVGQIQIYNVFGKEQGTIAINQGGDLGYVLPSSTRKFDESWQGPENLWDIGPYTAVVTLAYGSDGTKSASQSITFWVLPVGKLAEDVAALILIIGCFIFFLRRYVKKMLAREIGQYTPKIPPPTMPHANQAKREDKSGHHKETIDLRKR